MISTRLVHGLAPCLRAGLRAGLWTLALASLAGVAGACDPCVDVVARIEALAPGETLVVPGSCVVTESVTVPAGASVEGGAYALALGASITLQPSPDPERPTSLASARVEGGGPGASVVARGPGYVSITGTRFTLERGIAIGVAEAHASVRGVSVVGGLDPARVLELPVPADPAEVATYGLAAIDGAVVEATDLDVRLVAAAAVTCRASSLDVTRAALLQNRGVGVEAFGCELRLVEVEIADTLAVPLRPGVGVASGDSTLDAMGLHVHDSPGYGVLASGSDVTLTTPRIDRLGQAGVWAEGASTLVVLGGTFDENRGASIAAVGAQRLEVQGTTVARTALAPIPTEGGMSLERMGDAIHFAQRAGVASEVALSDLVLSNNARVGIVLDGAMSSLGLLITRTRVEATGTQLGALAQNIAALPVGWDAEVTRVGSAASLDATADALVVSDGTGLAGILMPPTIVF